MDKKKHDKPKDLAYYFTMFKIEGHETWRAHLGSDKGAFDRQWVNDQQGAATRPKITQRRDFRIDRITGSIDVRLDEGDNI